MNSHDGFPQFHFFSRQHERCWWLLFFARFLCGLTWRINPRFYLNLIARFSSSLFNIDNFFWFNPAEDALFPTLLFPQFHAGFSSGWPAPPRSSGHSPPAQPFFQSASLSPERPRVLECFLLNLLFKRVIPTSDQSFLLHSTFSEWDRDRSCISKAKLTPHPGKRLDGLITPFRSG